MLVELGNNSAYTSNALAKLDYTNDKINGDRFTVNKEHSVGYG